MRIPEEGTDQRDEHDARITADTVRIQEEERRRLSIELHDSIAQILGNLVLMMDACLATAPLDNDPLRQYLRRAQQTAKEGFRQVQRLSVDLRPPMLDDLGLAPALTWFAERFTKETDIPVAVTIPKRLPRLTADQETALFRITQEALYNVRKHSRANTVSVTLEEGEGTLRLAVQDDGVGFDPEMRRVNDTHLGLRGMHYRADLLKGTFHITSGPGRGTSIVIEIPLNTLNDITIKGQSHTVGSAVGSREG